MKNTTYHISNTVGTIQPFTSLSGTLTADAGGNINTLVYTGTVDFKDIINDGNVNTCVYFYIPSISAASDKIVKVTGITFVSFNENTGVYVYIFKVDKDISAVSSAAFSYTNIPLLGFSYLNVGGAAGTVDGVSIAATVGLSQPQPIIADQNYGNNFRPMYVDATGTDFLINVITHE